MNFRAQSESSDGLSSHQSTTDASESKFLNLELLDTDRLKADPGEFAIVKPSQSWKMVVPMVALPEPLQTPNRLMSPQAFLDWEATQEQRYEYVNGDVFAMSGGTIPHNDLAVNLLLALVPQVRAQGCRINVSDVKVKIRRRFRYPDLVVTGDERDKAATKLFEYPKVVVEVLSPSTEATDRGQKLREYQSIATLQEYVLINSDQAIVEVYRRIEGRVWRYESYGPDDSLLLESLGFDYPIGKLYEGIVLAVMTELEESEDQPLDR
jgi:Uma2 family endonuclease